MNVELVVFNPCGDVETSFGDFVFSHSGCGAIRQHRNPVTSEYTLSCGCGLELRFDRMGDAYNCIVDTVIDGLPHDLPFRSYSSSPTSAVRVVPHDIA